MNPRVWLVPVENRRTIGVDAGARPVKVLRLCSRTRGASEALCGAGSGLRCSGLCRFGADSEGFEAMRGGAERHRFGAALFGMALVWDYAVRSCVVRGYAGLGRRMQPGRAVIQPEFFFVA